MVEDINLDQSFEFVSQDSVPAHAPKPDDSPQKLITDLGAWQSTSDCEVDLVWLAVAKALIEEDIGEQIFCVVDALDEMDNCDFDDMLHDDGENMLRALMSSGMDINVKDEEGRNILWTIIEWGHEGLNVIKKFIRLGADPKERASDSFRTRRYISLN
ncbi:hypothetical protein QQZ08_010654 [Neonectria magnoliae]|uniref:Ankyrin repeat protein n=1 Tax=Neonectria magnoliae TaxID=2732573 RepID=A0ABR1HFU9_9HYPO